MSEIINNKAADLFSQIIFNQDVTLEPQLGSLSQGAYSAAPGPFVSQENVFAYDLRLPAEKGSLGHGNPILIKSLIDSAQDSDSLLVNYKIDQSHYHFLENLKDRFKSITLCLYPIEDLKVLGVEDILKKESHKAEVALLKNCIFLNESYLIEDAIFKYIDAKTYYFDLGIGLLLRLGQDDYNQNIPSFYQSFLDYYFKYLDNIVFNLGKGRISQLSATLTNHFDSLGLYINSKTNLEGKPIVYTEQDKSNILNIPLSITDEQLTKLIEILDDK